MDTPRKTEEFVIDLAEFFQALSDPSRVRIIFAIKETELSVGDIASVVNISESAVSHHLRSLRLLKLVKSRKIGRQRLYSLDDHHVDEIISHGLDHVKHG